MNTIETVYEDIFEGTLEEAREKFPVLKEGKYLRVLSSISKVIGVFPKEDSFYVVSSETSQNPKDCLVVVEETNSFNILNTIIKRETYQNYFLNEEDLVKVEEFLKENGCKNILKGDK